MIKKYILVAIVQDDKMMVDTTNDGYSATEIIGILEWKKQDIMAQMASEIKPDIVKRTLVEESE